VVDEALTLMLRGEGKRELKVASWGGGSSIYKPPNEKNLRYFLFFN